MQKRKKIWSNTHSAIKSVSLFAIFHKIRKFTSPICTKLRNYFVKTPSHKNPVYWCMMVVLSLAIIHLTLLRANSPLPDYAEQLNSDSNVPLSSASPEIYTEQAYTPDSIFLQTLKSSISELLDDQLSIREASEGVIERNIQTLSEILEAAFEDETLYTIAQNYIEALMLEKESFSLNYSESDICWYQGFCQQMQLLNHLNSSYGFMDGNSRFQEKFIVPLSDTLVFFNKYKIISSDISSQVQATYFLDYVNDYRYSLKLTNRTNYTYSVIFYFENYNDPLDSEADLISIEQADDVTMPEPDSTSQDTLTGVEPLKNYIVTDRVSGGVASMKDFRIYWCITEIT